MWNSGIRRLPDMGQRAREILSANLTALMAAKGLTSIKKLANASSVSTGTVDRARRGIVGVSVDQLDGLASAFGLEPWQLLVEGVRLPELSADALDFAKLYEKLNQGERSKLRALYQVAREGVQPGETWKAPNTDRSNPQDNYLGGISDFGGLDEPERPGRKRK